VLAGGFSLTGELPEEKMRYLAVGAAVALLLIGSNAKVFAGANTKWSGRSNAKESAAQSQVPTAITECGDITQAGNYVVENDLVLLVAGQQDFGMDTCLTISASRVKIDMGGNSIGVACSDPFLCLPQFGVPGGIGILVAAGSDSVSISNGAVDNYVYGIVADQDYYMSLSNLELTAVVGVTLSDVSLSTVNGITYFGADADEHGTNGPLLYVSGGSHNLFNNLSGATGTDIGLVDAVEIDGSNANSFSQLNLENDSSCTNAALALSGGSSFNLVASNTIVDTCGAGIEVDTGGRLNFIVGNTVTTISPPDVFAMLDENPKCGSDFWFLNTFTNEGDRDPSDISASPSTCIH
jgi:hypothetical protein